MYIACHLSRWLTCVAICEDHSGLVLVLGLIISKEQALARNDLSLTMVTSVNWEVFLKAH